jgi:NAD(P)-dependent dehydrogenase (short-subunit alcohol dehydrogenase family)
MSVDAAQMRLAGLGGRVALVTGASSGIGRRTAETLAALGARTAGGDLAPPDVPNVFGVELDVASEQSVETAFSTVEAELGRPEILVLNAGIFAVEPLEATTLEGWRRMIAVNLDGAFLCARRALPTMRERRFGRIVAIGSTAGVSGGAVTCAAYAASKAGLMTLMKAIATEYARYGITANAVAPALIETAMLGGISHLAVRIPVGRVGAPDDVAACVAFLCSDHASYITGEILDVNGGFLMD